MKKLATVIAAITLIGTPAFAADMALKAPPPAPAPVPTWTGFYGGIQVGGGWSDEAVNYSANDPGAAALLSGTLGFTGEQPLANYRTPQSGPVGGIEAGYNWQAGPNWVLGFETDFSGSGISGHGSATSLVNAPFAVTTTAAQSTDWYGTIRGRAGWLATPNLLVFGTGGFAYGSVADSANFTSTGGFTFSGGGFAFSCVAGAPCFAGSSSTTKTGWTAGGGLEWRGLWLDPHMSFKIEYQFVDLGTETVRLQGTPCPPTVCTIGGPFIASSFNAAFHNQFNVVRVGLNYQFH